MKKNILITGGLGILGAALVKKLNKQNFNIFIIDRSKNIKKIKVLGLHNLNKVKIIKGNFINYKSVFKIVKKFRAGNWKNFHTRSHRKNDRSFKIQNRFSQNDPHHKRYLKKGN